MKIESRNYAPNFWKKKGKENSTIIITEKHIRKKNST